jgi:hypothetical protein
MNPSHNRVKLEESFMDFKDNRLSFSVSCRNIRPDIDVMDYLRVFYTYCDPHQIESVFGSTNQYSRLYGGRLSRKKYELTENHLTRLTENGIHLALTLTNHFFDNDSYRESWPLLEKNHRKGNSIICTHDDLAVCLKRDFPLYEIKASIIKKLDTLDKITRALDIYDSLTLPMDKNDDDVFLNSIREKDRIILFGNANCAYTCPARTCYLGFSQENFGLPTTSTCSKGKTPRLDMGHVYFNVKKLADMGYTRFKLVPLAPEGSLQACRKLSWKKGYLIEPIRRNKPVHFLCSYPKCGRTWLRFILAQYLNRLYNLDMMIDLHSLFSLMPTDEHDYVKGVNAYRFQDDPRFPLLLASHKSPQMEKFDRDKSSRIVFILRSIPDVVVSNFFHRTHFMKCYKGGLKDFIRDPKEGVAQYCRYLNLWAPLLDSGRSLILTYEMLHEHTEKTVSNLLTFLDIPIDDVCLKEAVQLSTFDAMRAIEEESGMPDHQAQPDDPEDRRVRRGKVGGSTDYLDSEDLEYIKRTIESLLTDTAKSLLRNHRLMDH